MASLKDLLSPDSVEKLFSTDQKAESLHRTRGVVDRPVEEVSLGSLAKEVPQILKTQKDPTADLVELPVGRTEIPISGVSSGSYLVWCADTSQMWYAPTKLCLDQNFIYREDLEIAEFSSIDAFDTFYRERCSNLLPGVITCKSCYLLDNPGNESYEVYYDSNYPAQHYGQATPKGCFIHKYKNRFHRDMAILNLDLVYTHSSAKAAIAMTKQQLGPNEAIIVSDGAWMREVCSCAFFYMDADSVVKQVEGSIPTDAGQAVLIAEVNGAFRALQMCKARGRKQVSYYYDNTSILNIWKNHKTEYLPEVRRYKELCRQLDQQGFQVEFIELHPKTGDDRVQENKALQFFHNTCDSECRVMSDIYRKDYRAYASTDTKKGTQLRDARAMAAPRRKGHK